MAQMHLGEPDFADMLLRTKPSQSTKFLEKLDEQIDWTPFKDILSSIYSSHRGRKSFPLITLLKCLLIQQWYDPSDYALEDAINDRLSFRAFVGISMSEDVPDHSVFSRFRSQLRDKGLMDDLFIELDRQLEIKGLVLKKGTLVDASVVQANVSPPSQTKEGKAGKSEIDQDARWVCWERSDHLDTKCMLELIRKAVLFVAMHSHLPTHMKGIFCRHWYVGMSSGYLLIKPMTPKKTISV